MSERLLAALAWVFEHGPEIAAILTAPAPKLPAAVRAAEPAAEPPVATAPSKSAGAPATVAPAEASAAPATRGDCGTVLDYVRNTQPVTAPALAKYLDLTVAHIESIVAEFEQSGEVKRWTDNSPTGDGRVYFGTINRRGVPEPELDAVAFASAPEIDPRTLLAVLRRGAIVTAKQLARQWRLPFGRIMDTLKDLERQGQVKLNKRPSGAVYVEAVDPSWND